MRENKGKVKLLAPYIHTHPRYVVMWKGGRVSFMIINIHFNEELIKSRSRKWLLFKLLKKRYLVGRIINNIYNGLISRFFCL